MAWFDIKGNVISTIYDMYGGAVGTDTDGEPIPPATMTDYQTAIINARDAWTDDADDQTIPLIISTDQHGYWTAAKPMFEFLASYLSWGRISADINLGDCCGGVYSTQDLTSMVLSTRKIPAAKKILVPGNHDAWIKDGSTRLPTPEEWDTMYADSYFNNSAYGTDYQRGEQGIETMVDTAHHVRYVTLNCWDDYYGDYAKYHQSPGMIDDIIRYLSIADGNDVIVLTHVHMLAGAYAKNYPAVDGNEASSTSGAYKDSGMDIGLDTIYAARKNKTAGTYTDAEGVAHPYDFRGCNSDLLCVLAGHVHIDRFTHAPMLLAEFDAMGYDAHPVYFVNIDRSNNRLNAWKVGDDASVSPYSLPL